MTLALRIPTYQNHLVPHHAYPSELQIDAQQATNHLPWLHATFNVSMPEQVAWIVRVHNLAGIPIIQGSNTLEAGQTLVTFRNLQALGIEAYAHYTDEQRCAIIQRIWSRRAYCTLSLANRPQE